MVTVMDRLFLSILNMSLTGTFVIAAICLIRLLLKASKVPKIISYCLWAVAGFRLIIPFSVESVFGLIPFRSQPIPIIERSIMPAENVISNTLPALPTVTPEIFTHVPAVAVPAQNWAVIAALIWLLGVASMVVYGAVSYVILNRKMRTAVCIGSNIYEAENIKSPFVLGVINPKIFLPAGLSADENEYILLHERTHIRRRDHIVKFAAYFILALHWFNPLAWVAFLLLGADMEMSCDERVLKELGRKTDYSRLLVAFASKRRFIGTSPLAFGEGGMKERVKNVLNFKKRSRIAVAVAVVLTMVVSVGLMIDRAALAEQPTTPSIEDGGRSVDEVIRDALMSFDNIQDVQLIIPGRVPNVSVTLAFKDITSHTSEQLQAMLEIVRNNIDLQNGYSITIMDSNREILLMESQPVFQDGMNDATLSVVEPVAPEYSLPINLEQRRFERIPSHLDEEPYAPDDISISLEWRTFQELLQEYGWNRIVTGQTLEGPVTGITCRSWSCEGRIYMEHSLTGVDELSRIAWMREGWIWNDTTWEYITTDGTEYAELSRVAFVTFRCTVCSAHDTALYVIAYTEYAWFPIP